MNPLAALLALLSLAGFLVRRRELAVAWAVVGIAGMALLAPALAIPDGVPSPSAILGRLAPWQGTVGEAPGNPAIGDVTFQIEPLLVYLRSELRAGRVPYWNPYQSAGAPFWGNGQSAPLFPLHLLFVLLPERAGFLLLPWLRLLIAGLGAWWLARELGVGRRGALLAGVIYPLSGRLASFLLFPMANGLCLVPWAFFATERIAARGRGFVLLAAIAALQLLGGHPETPLMTAVASGLYLAFRGVGGEPGERAKRALATWGRVIGGWVTGGAVAAVQLLPLAHVIFASSRWHDSPPNAVAPLAHRAASLVRFLLPNAFGTPMAGDVWGEHWGPFNFTASTVYLGAVCLPLALWGIGSAGEGRVGPARRRAFGATALLCLAAAAGAPGVRHLLDALPILGRSIHHYLLLGVALPAAILAGAGLERWRTWRREERPPAGLVAACAVPVVGLTLAWLFFAERWRAQGQLAGQAAWSVWVLAVALLLVAGLAARPRLRDRLASLAVAATLLELAVAHAPSNPGLSLGDHYPETGVVRFLRERAAADGPAAGRVAGVGLSLRPNAGMVYRIAEIGGDDSLKLRWYEEMWARELGPGHPTFFRPVDRWTSPWLDRLAVRWVMARPGAAPPVAGWRLAYRGPDAILFERPAPLPLVRLAPPPAPAAPASPADERAGAPEASAEILERLPNRWRIAWRSRQEAILVVAQTWDAGWRAEVDGRPVPVEPFDEVLTGLRLGPGEGEVLLAYRPPGIGLGAVVSLVGLATLVGGSLGARLRSRSAPGASPDEPLD